MFSIAVGRVTTVICFTDSPAYSAVDVKIFLLINSSCSFRATRNTNFESAHAMKYDTKNIIIVILLFIIAGLIVLLFLKDSGRYCSPVMPDMQQHMRNLSPDSIRH
jgi:hypothetical protein